MGNKVKILIILLVLVSSLEAQCRKGRCTSVYPSIVNRIYGAYNVVEKVQSIAQNGRRGKLMLSRKARRLVKKGKYYSIWEINGRVVRERNKRW
jgi:hypothetical protein